VRRCWEVESCPYHSFSDTPTCTDRHPHGAAISPIRRQPTHVCWRLLLFPLFQCFQLCGLVFGSFFLILIAAASAFSVYITVSCSRRIRHGASYEEVVGSTFGRPMGRLVIVALFALVYLCVVAYTILIRDLVSPLLELLFDTTYGRLGRFVIVACVLLLVMPICMQKSIHALGWTSIVSVAAMIILAYCVVYRGMEQLLRSYSEPNHARFHDGGLKLGPASWNDVIYAAPIIACSFACHFNVLPLHRELIHPTRPRIKKMINWYARHDAGCAYTAQVS
jgi:amino acid permease